MKLFRPFTSVTRWLLVVVGCVVLATTQPMSAASDTADTARTEGTIIYPKSSAERPTPAPSELEKSDHSQRSFIITIALLLALGGAWVLIQRRQAGVPGLSRGQKKLQVEETRSLGNRQYLIVATYEDKKFLLGVTTGQIQLLTHLTEEAPASSPKP